MLIGLQPAYAQSTFGPDAFGHTAFEIPGNLRDISTSGTFVPLGDDQLSTPIPIPFSFNFYGVPVTDLRISSNGFITFGNTFDNGCCTGDPIPSPGEPNNLIAGFWEDLNNPQGDIAFESFSSTTGSSGSQEMVIGFYSVPHFSGTNPVTFEIILHEAGSAIELQYGDAPSDGGTHTVGIENADGTDGLEIANGDVSFFDQGFMIVSASIGDILLSKADIHFGTKSRKSEKSGKSNKSGKSGKSLKQDKVDGYKIRGEFQLSELSNYIDPLNEDVIVSVGASTLVIPAGSFSMNDDLSKAEFEGTIGDVTVKAKIEELSSSGLFRFDFDATGVILSGSSNPISVSLSIGDDQGFSTILLEGKLKLAE